MLPEGTIALVVEDYIWIAQHVERMLARLGIIIRIAGSVAQATASIAELRPSVVLMDICLPEGTEAGIEAARHIQSDLGIPVIITTAHDDDRGTHQRIRAAGDFLFLPKPYAEADFAAVIQAALAKTVTSP
jgi:CheY-like chemotaxis protein